MGTLPISSTMSRGRGDLNLSSPRSVFSNPSVLRTPPLYFAMQNTEEEVNIFLCIVFVLLPCRVPQHCGKLRQQYKEETEDIVVLRKGVGGMTILSDFLSGWYFYKN